MTLSLTHETEEVVEGRVIRLAQRPITFERFLDLTGEDNNLELVKGVMVKRMAAQYPHERRFVWLLFLLNGYVRQRGLGVVLGSRTAVEIDKFGGRLPDILFVRADREEIVQERAIYVAPDLVIEIVSPNDRPADLVALEADYRSIGVPEIVFVDPQKRHLLHLRRRDEDYDIAILTGGTFRLEAVAGFHVEVAWLFQEPLPNEYDVLTDLLAETRPAE